MAKKATIQKLREDMLITEGSKKTVFPQTIDKAVATKWEEPNPQASSLIETQTYKSLEYVLGKKLSNAWAYTATNGEGYKYLLFTFSTPVKLKNFVKYVTCDKTEFEDLVRTHGDEHDVAKLSNYSNSEYQVQSFDDLQARLEFDMVNNLRIDYLDLHKESLGQIVVSSDDDEVEPNGIVQFNEYPGKVLISLRGIDLDEHGLELVHLAMAVNNNDYYFEANSTKQPSEEYVNMATRWNDGNAMPPLDIISRIPRAGDFDYNIVGCVNFLQNEFENGGLWLYIYPEDYPVKKPGQTDIQYNEELEEYKTQAKKGVIKVKEVLKLNNVEQNLLHGVLPAQFTVIFNPHSVFTFTSPTNTIALNSSNDWKGSFIFKGENANDNCEIKIGLVSTSNVINAAGAFKIGKDGQNEEEYVSGSNTLSITAEELLAGVKVNVMPETYYSQDVFARAAHSEETQTLPYLDAVDVDIPFGIKCTYTDLDTGISKEIIGRCNSIVTNADIVEYEKMTVTVKVYLNETERRAMFDVTFDNTLEDFIIKRMDLIARLPNVGSIIQKPKTIENIPYVYTTEYLSTLSDTVISGVNNLSNDTIIEAIQAGAWTIVTDATNEDNGILDAVYTAEQLENRRMLICAIIPEQYSDNDGKIAILEGYVVLHAQTQSGTAVRAEIPFKYNEEGEEGGGIHEDIDIETGATPVLLSRTSDLYKTINAVGNGPKLTLLTNGYLAKIDTLYAGVFSMLPDLENADFLQYMNITEIPDECFMGDTSLSSVVIPDTVTRIGRHAFLGTALEEVVVPDSVTEIGEYAFAGCDNLTTVDIGKGVTLLRDTIFEHSSSIADVYLRNDTEFVQISRMLGQTHQLFDAGMTVTLHVPDVDIEIVDLNDEVQTVNLMDAYTNPSGRWMNIPNVTVNVVAIED